MADAGKVGGATLGSAGYPMALPVGEATAPQPRSFWIAVICGAVILTIGIGARQSFGIFQKPIAADLKVGRELWSFANALAMLLMGAFSPFAGNVADRFGTARTVAAGGVLYVTGMFTIGPDINNDQRVLIQQLEIADTVSKIVGRHDLRALVQQLVERVLAHGAFRTPQDRCRGVGEGAAFAVHSLPVRLHFELLQVGRQKA